MRDQLRVLPLPMEVQQRITEIAKRQGFTRKGGIFQPGDGVENVTGEDTPESLGPPDMLPIDRADVSEVLPTDTTVDHTLLSEDDDSGGDAVSNFRNWRSQGQ